jgi:hypothetical protein
MHGFTGGCTRVARHATNTLLTAVHLARSTLVGQATAAAWSRVCGVSCLLLCLLVTLPQLIPVGA